MLGELEFIEGDWAALLWAIGSTTALLRHSIPRQLRTNLERRFGSVRRLILKDLGKGAIGVLMGLMIAGGVLAICVVAFLRLVPNILPQWQLSHEPFVEWLTVIVIPEAVFIATAIALWSKKRSIATGLLLAAMTFITHVIIHAATHG
jgi:hypothetical protein